MSPQPQRKAPCAEVLEPVTWLEMRNSDRSLRLVVPGAVFFHAGRVVSEVVAAAMVSIGGGKAGPGGTVLLRFAADPCDLAKSDADFPEKALRDDAVTAFSLEVEADTLGGAELLELAEHDAAGPTSPLAVTLRQRVSFDRSRKNWTSAPLRGIAALTADPFPGNTPDDALPFLFDCHSHWYSQRRTGKPTRYWTVCHGDCTGSTCHCAGRASRRCAGWKFCWC
jgi:hypothetical protein